jgi:hypothetical protein
MFGLGHAGRRNNEIPAKKNLECNRIILKDAPAGFAVVLFGSASLYPGSLRRRGGILSSFLQMYLTSGLSN